MLTTHLIVALRKFAQHKLHTLLNLFGLGLGLAGTILVALFAWHESSYDFFQPNVERVYRVETDFSAYGFDLNSTANYQRAKQFRQVSQVEDIFALLHIGAIDPTLANVKNGEQAYKLNKMFVATNNIEDFVALTVLNGDIQAALSAPWQLALSKQEALRIFGSTDVLGKTLQNKSQPYTVAAVFDDLPANSHFSFDSLTYTDANKDDYRTHMNYLYLKTLPDSDIRQLQEELTDIYAIGEERGKLRLSLRPLRNIHLYSGSSDQMKPSGSAQVLILCYFLCFLLLGTACINFINMSVAQTATRLREVVIRKSLGASRPQLLVQFLIESILISLFATLVGCAMAELCLPWVNQLLDRTLTLNYSFDVLAGLLALALFVGIVAGLYPALLLANIKSRANVDGLHLNRSVTWVRKGLLIIQTALSISLIIATLVLSLQLRHVQNYSPGYDTTARLVISNLPADEVYTAQPGTIIRQFRALQGVSNVGLLDTIMSGFVNYSFKLIFPNGMVSEQYVPGVGTGFNAVENLGLTLIAGRGFSPDFQSDWFYHNEQEGSVAVMVTESTARLGGYRNPQDIIGKTLTRDELSMRVVGVVQDVMLGNTREAQSSVVFLCGYTLTSALSVVLKVDEAALTSVQQETRRILATELNIYDANINVLQDTYDGMFDMDKRIEQLVQAFGLLAMLLAVLGIFGLASFTALNRQKEIAIRKVLGASRISIINLLSKQFMGLSLLSVPLAFAITYWLLENWLNGFQQRIEQHFAIYLLAMGLILMTVWLTVAGVALVTLKQRPAHVLRND